MKPNRALLAILVPVSLFAWGCAEDVGDCDDPNSAQDTVLVGKQIQYAGQAIINVSCTTACHNSTLHGNARHGAPEGLDFDVNPLAEGDKGTDGTISVKVPTLNDAGTVDVTIVNLDADAVKALRSRQRTIFEKRNAIWTQIKEGLMPPDGKYKTFQSLVRITDSVDSSPCTATSAAKFLPITSKPSQDLLRNWLACNTPIVEAQGPDVGLDGVPGQAGYQYLACENVTTNPGDGGVKDSGTDSGGAMMSTTVTLDDLQDDIFGNAACSACHPSLNPSGVKLDFSSIDLLYAALVTDTSMQCNGKPYVTPGDPTKSWFYDVLALKSPGCGTEQMPQGGTPLTASQLKEVSDWITQGAKRASDIKSLQNPLAGGLDAGLP